MRIFWQALVECIRLIPVEVAERLSDAAEAMTGPTDPDEEKRS